jgi:Tol biopolymer transport system component
VLGSPMTALTGGLWILPVPGGQPQRVGNLLASDATWGPDGDSIYYAKMGEIGMARRDGSEARKLISVHGYPFWIRFSPDGRAMRFSLIDADKTDTSTLWEARADGSHLRQLLAGWNAVPNDCCGSWTADGKYFVFQSSRGGSWNVWAMRENAEWWRKANPAPEQLTPGQTSSLYPLPSVDGKKIFFMGMTPRGELVRYDPGKKLFSPMLPGLSAAAVVYSRDGSRIAYVRVPEGTLWQSKADGSDPHQLTFPPMQVGGPRWSPDGTKIAFNGQEAGNPAKIYTVASAGGSPEQQTSGKMEDIDPTWSPHSDALVFGGSLGATLSTKEHPIEVLNLQTHELTTLPDSGGYFSPRWSPDGRWVVAVDGDSEALVLYDFTTRRWETLTKIPAMYPNWSQDGQSVYFCNADAKMPVYRVFVKEHKTQLVVNLADGGNLVSATFNLWTGLAPDGSILGLRDISLEEIYSMEVEIR